MKSANVCLIGLMFVVSVSAEPLLEGRVRLESGEPVADAQVRLFDMSDLRQGAIARAQTDGTGYFALPLAALGGRALPERFALGPNYPNPFNPSTIIPYQLASSSPVRLEVFNLLGQRIATLVDGVRPAGFHTATWHATDAAGRAVGAGVYIYRMTVGAASQTGRMVLIDGQAGVVAAGAASVWSGVSGGGRSDGTGEQAYGLIVSGEGLVPYVDSSFRVEAGMPPVELVVSAGPHQAGKVTDLFDALNDAEEEEEAGPSGKAQATLEAPPEPTNLRFEAVTDSSCLVRWDAVEGATDYDVNYKPAVGGTWTNEPHKGVQLYNTIYDLEPNTEYRWAARAENGDGASEWVFGPNFTTLPDNDAPETIPDNDAPETIPDANLRAVIEDALGKASGAPITVAEMETLTSLDARDKGIRSLTGLEFATNLTSLNLSPDAENGPINRVSDLSPLSGLTNLTRLNLGRNRVSDISALAGLTNLTELGLWANRVWDLSPLSGLTNLTGLDLNGNNVSDISALAGLTNLTWLVLGANSIADLSPLVANTGLGHGDYVDLRGNLLSYTALYTHIPALRSRGVTVRFDDIDGDSDDCDTRSGEAVDDASETISDANLRPVIVADRFGREVNDAGITLVDWEGHIGNPAIQYTVKAPSSEVCTWVKLSASDQRLYFNLPSEAGAEGPKKRLNLDRARSAMFHMSVFPDRDGQDETHLLTIEYLNDQGVRYIETVDIHVIDQDRPGRGLSYGVTVDFSYDETGLYDDAGARRDTRNAVQDWVYFFDGTGLDEVPAGQQPNRIWDAVEGWPTGRTVYNKEPYTGFLLYASGSFVGTGGGPSWDGGYQSVNGETLPLRRSGDIQMEKDRGLWDIGVPDEKWWSVSNLGGTLDFYGGSVHEIGHALIFNPGYPKLQEFMELGYINSKKVRDYYAAFVPKYLNDGIDRSFHGEYIPINVNKDGDDHLPLGIIDTISRRNVWSGEMPHGRYPPTKGELLIAEAIGYTLRETTPFMPLSISEQTPPAGTQGAPYEYTAEVNGGIPAYYWAIQSGSLPEGLALDSFTGTISGTPNQHGTFNFTISVNDYDETTPSITRAVTLIIR